MPSIPKTRDDDQRGGGGQGFRGNPPHERTEQMARQIEQMAGLQLVQRDIATILGISEDTIQRHYSEDYARGKTRSGLTLRNRAFEMAMGRLKDQDKPELGYEREPDRAMIMFLLKCQFGFRETSRHEIINPGGPQSGGHDAADAVAARLSQLREREAEADGE
jgi:DNA-binding CsgD family transcriptional regulator